MELSHGEGRKIVNYFRPIIQDGVTCHRSSIAEVTESVNNHYLRDLDCVSVFSDSDIRDIPSTDFSTPFSGDHIADSPCMQPHELSPARTPRDVSRVDGIASKEIPVTDVLDSDVLFDVQDGFSRYGHYSPVEIIPGLSIETQKSFDYHANLLGSQLNIPGWLRELEHENDINLRNYLSFGIQQGFYIVDADADITPYQRDNYSSVLKGDAHSFVDQLLKSELEQRKYVFAEIKPMCIHGLGAVPKKSGGWRPITDCKRPIGHSINSFMSTTFKEFCYATVDNVIELIQPGDFMSSVDISAAYRSILIHPSQWKFQGIAWDFDGDKKFLYDTHGCFGLRCAPYLFTQITNFVLRCLQRRGFTRCLVYLDDFLVLGSSAQECIEAQQMLISILRSLGFYIAWKKCVAPSQIITYLGVTFNSVQMSVSLPQDKMDRLHQELKFFIDKDRATKHQIQRLCGILSHCAKVVRGGRTFSQRVISLLKGWPSSRNRIRLSKEFKNDLYLWKDFAAIFNGENQMIKFNYGCGPTFFTDSCLSGYGFWENNDWQAGYFNTTISPDTSNLNHSHNHWMNIHVDDSDSSNINVLELIPVWLCLKRNLHSWRGLHVLCRTDNVSVQYMINKGISSNDLCMSILREIFWLCANNNVYVSALHIPGNENIIADVLSRIRLYNSVSVINDYNLCCSSSHSSGYG